MILLLQVTALVIRSLFISMDFIIALIIQQLPQQKSKKREKHIHVNSSPCTNLPALFHSFPSQNMTDLFLPQCQYFTYSMTS